MRNKFSKLLQGLQVKEILLCSLAGLSHMKLSATT